MASDRPVRRPNIEIKRQLSPGYWRVYGHLYWRPLIVVVLGRVLVGRRALRRMWGADDEH